MKYPVWDIGQAAPEAAAALQQAGIPALLAQILASRGLDTPALAGEFLGSVRAPLPDPTALGGMAAARERVLLALEHGERICVFGDYDVDGVTATCLLCEYLRGRGGDVVSYIPGRLDEGYGLSARALEQLHGQGVRLVVTVDCGITAVEEARLCRELGMDLVITDHHTCGDTLPEALAVVDPHRPGDGYPFCGLAGVGVAFKLAAAIEGEQQSLLARFCDLLALGTVADVMPLLGENRAIVAQGVAALQTRPRVGVRALLAESGAESSAITATSIGYLLAPRINAAGRMGQADIALRLLLTRDAGEAAALAATLCTLNRERQSVEQAIHADARRQLAGQTPEVIVLASADWHQGVVGIVASRLSEEYGCPACLICLDGESGKASCRSYGGFPLIDALHRLSPLLERYGGHQLAAGFTIRAGQIDTFRQALTELAHSYRAGGAPPASIRLDCRVTDPALLTLSQVEALQALEPCGAECPRPMICVSGLTVVQAAEVGGGRHLRLRLRLGDEELGGIFFSMTALRAGVAPGDVIEAACMPQINEFRGLRSVQLQLTDLRLMDPERTACEAERRLYQRHRSGEPLTQPEAASLLPPRSEFVAVWRYLKGHCQDGVLREQADCLCRKIARSMGQPVSFVRTRICLDVFQECGLLSVSRRQEQYEIRLKDEPAQRVDLNRSPILLALRQRCGGETG